jgi:hypothetical protein
MFVYPGAGTIATDSECSNYRRWYVPIGSPRSDPPQYIYFRHAHCTLSHIYPPISLDNFEAFTNVVEDSPSQLTHLMHSWEYLDGAERIDGMCSIVMCFMI